MHGSLDDVLAVGRELLEPRLVAAETHEEMTTVQFPGLDGVLPDFGRFRPLDWGLGVELKGAKEGHWSAAHLGATFGHFGGSGTFLDRPALGVACAALTTRDFGDWAKDAWPRLSDAVVDERLCAAVSSRRRRRAAAGARRTSRGRSSPTHGVIVVTVAVRGTPIASATSPNQSPGRIIPRGPRVCWLTPAMPEEHDVEAVALLALRHDRRPGGTSSRSMRSASLVRVWPGREDRSSTRESSVTDAGT